MTSSIRQPAYGAVRISPDGVQLAWYRPGFSEDRLPWLVVCEDPALGVEHCWVPESDVAGWAVLEDPAVVRADDAQLAARIRQAGTDPMPTDLVERVNQAMHAATNDALDGGFLALGWGW